MGLDPGSVWLDARGTQSVGHAERGIARYVTEHAAALLEVAPETIGAVGLSPDIPVPASAESLLGSGKVAWQTRERGPDGEVPPIYHVMSPFEADLGLEEIWPVWTRESRLVVTLYDLIPLIMRERYNADWGYMATAWIARLGLLGSAQQILTISQHTAEDAMERLNIPEERITVIDSGCLRSLLLPGRHPGGGRCDPPLRRCRGSAPASCSTWAASTTARTWRARSAPTPSCRRRCATPTSSSSRATSRSTSASRLRVLARSLGIESRNLLLTGFVSDRDLAALYRSCELFVFPSLYEGAGLPILEAMTCGAPVAASRTSAIPELLGDLEATFDPADPADIARCIREVLETPGRSSPSASARGGGSRSTPGSGSPS